ncbi:nuclear transport factor 2 family protein [Variovorax sp. J22P271]|uniref:nuclear transport factor 2 family protein n=1 Tax=Variovorax davisae TaxID=3053515 RepID=UPI0025778C04|nr:nuclear transport factor 2 family protein [Variovorax sp. J22P271]MDM0034869.1 nuclear transport factor 2 family protein [Variovorax sp. J22P271]
MGTPTEIAKQGYAAFGRRDIPALLELLADDVEWRFLASPETGTPYGGTCRGKQQVAEFFGKLAQADEILEFEPREFLEGPGHVTVLGRTKGRALPDGKVHESEWVQVFSWKDGSKISRWVGTADTAARLAK